MKPEFHPISLMLSLICFVAIVAGASYSLCRLQVLRLPRERAFATFYFAALFTYCAMLFTGSQLNPRDQVGGWGTSPFVQAVTGLAFLACLLLPPFTRLRWPYRIAATAASFLILAAAFWLWYVSTA